MDVVSKIDKDPSSRGACGTNNRRMSNSDNNHSFCVHPVCGLQGAKCCTKYCTYIIRYRHSHFTEEETESERVRHLPMVTQ